MPLPQRLFPGDEELGKKDDDHRPGMKGSLGLTWNHRRMHGSPRRKNVKFVALAVLGVIAMYYFFKYMPTDLQQPRVRPTYSHSAGGNAPTPNTDYSDQHKSSILEKTIPARDFNGPIKFYNLASTLHAVSRTKGLEPINRNVLFAAANLKSAAVLLPIACEMALRARNLVHFALMGRDDISMDILKSMNGIGNECNVMFHDARPDFSASSSDIRMQISVGSSLSHINNFVHPQATFIDASGLEEIWFLKGMKTKASSLDITLIQLPQNAEHNLMWITLLDSSSLNAWNKVSIDIIIHAQPSGTGSLVRLLKSMEKADFFASTPPRLTIELPHKPEKSVLKYIYGFKWPPKAATNLLNLLTLHHRIPQRGITPEENSIRMLESFWPTDPFGSQVLILSPQVELSPLFYHYLKYAILEYRYSTLSQNHEDNIIGISLDLPSTYLNDTMEFVPPLTEANEATSFLWQAPNSNACLFFGEKWTELHDFVSRSLNSKSLTSSQELLSIKKKEVSTTYPSWLEYILQLARIRGYLTIYPNFKTKESLTTIHTDLYQFPEEYKENRQAVIDPNAELTGDLETHLSLKHTEYPIITAPLLSILPSKGGLPGIEDMPLLSWDGEKVNKNQIGERSYDYISMFRKEIGACPENTRKQRIKMSAEDLFCDDKLEAEKESKIRTNEPSG